MYFYRRYGSLAQNFQNALQGNNANVCITLYEETQLLCTIQTAHTDYLDAFNDELSGFKQRIRTRAKQKLDEAIHEHEEDERQKRLGPGGLDPQEVFEALPDALKECFESKDIGKLQDVILTMPKEDAEYHMKRGVESGLWVPNAQEKTGVQEEGDGAEEEEETYEDVS